MADQDELDKNLRRLISNIDSFDDAIIGKDLNGTIFSWNNGAESSYGYSPAEVVGKSISIIIPPERHGEFVDILARINRGERIKRHETVRVRKDGKRIDVSITVSPIMNDKGEVIGATSIARDITERKRADEALLEVQEKYRSLYNSLLELVYVHDFEGNFLDANPSALELLGYSAEELKALNFSSLLDPVQLPQAIEAANELKTTGRQKQSTQYRLRKKNGEYLEVETIASVIYDHGRPYAIEGIGRDITERKRANDALRESETRYRMLMESAGESILVLQDGMIKMVNAMGTAVTGYSQQELVSTPFLQMIHPDDRALVGDRHQRRLKGEAVPSGYDFRVLAKDGSTKWVHVRAVAVEWKGRPATLNIMMDITESKRAEMELRTKTAEALESSERARSYFDFLAHDISNMLSPIMAYAELMRLDKRTPEPSRIKAGKIVDQTRRASSFILSLRRLEDAELIRQERMESRDLSTTVDEAVTRVKAEYEDKRISATVIRPAGQVMFKGGKHLESIILGILENSVEAAVRDDVALEVKSTIVEENGRKFLRLELTDDGPGISDDLKGCFMVSKDPRKQFEMGISKGVASTLLISSAIVKSLGGELWMEDRIPGDCSKGARVVIKFPQEGFFGT